MMKKFLPLILLLFCCSSKQLPVSVKSGAVILMDAKTGKILFSKHGDEPYPPASTMKIVTAICAIESGHPLDTTIIGTRELMKKVSRKERIARGGYDAFTHELTPDATVFDIKHGEKLTLKDLLFGAMLISGGDACNHIAKFITGNLDQFVVMMNQLAQNLGCKKTRFYNTHGFYHPKQVTTPRELALMTCYALKNPIFKQIASAPDYERPKTNKQDARLIKNYNALVCPESKYYFPGAFGVKTGFHSEAKWNLIAAAECGERTLIAVIMQGDERKYLYQDALALFKAATEETKKSRMLFAAEESQFKRVLKDAKYPIYAKLSRDVSISYFPSDEPRVSAEIVWRDLQMPLSMGDLLGELRVVSDSGELLATRPLFLKHKPKPTFWFQLRRFFVPWGCIGIFGALALVFFYPRKR